MIVYAILVTLFLSPALISHSPASSWFAEKQLLSEEVDASPELFDAFAGNAAAEKSPEYNLDRELGLVTPDQERDGSSSSSSSGSIRIVPSHFSSRLSSSGSAEEKTDDSDLSPVEEPFEMISSAEFRSEVPDE
jgi:hypothetical protein